MTTIDLTTIDIDSLGAVKLRQLGAEMGIKGASRGRKAELITTLRVMQADQIRERDARAALAPKPQAKKATALDREVYRGQANQRARARMDREAVNKCIVCSRRPRSTAAQRRREGIGGSDFADMCMPCYREGSWENTHSDYAHDAILAQSEETRTEQERDEIAGCWICFPELNEASADYAPAKGTARQGQVVVAKGTEVHKSETFKAAAELAGWEVVVQSETYELPDGTTGNGTRHYATATKGDESISLAWDGRAYDYPNSSAVLAGKPRKVRNLKEALRLMA